MKKSLTAFLVLFTIAGSQQLVAQQKSDVNLPDSVNKSHNSLLVIPYVFYTPETDWGGGVSAGYYFLNGESRRISNIQGVAVYTLQDQFKLSVTPKFFSED